MITICQKKKSHFNSFYKDCFKKINKMKKHSLVLESNQLSTKYTTRHIIFRGVPHTNYVQTLIILPLDNKNPHQSSDL